MKLSGVVGTYSWCPSSSSLTRGLLKVQCAAVREDSHCARRKHLEIAPSRSPWFVSAGLEMMLGWRDGETRRFTSSFSLYSRPISNFPSSSAFLSITPPSPSNSTLRAAKSISACNLFCSGRARTWSACSLQASGGSFQLWRARMDLYLEPCKDELREEFPAGRCKRRKEGPTTKKQCQASNQAGLGCLWLSGCRPLTSNVTDAQRQTPADILIRPDKKKCVQW